MAIRTIIEMEDHTVTIVGSEVTIQANKPSKDPLARISKSYADPHAIRVVVGRLMGQKDPEGFLSDLICRFKQDMVRAGKI